MKEPVEVKKRGPGGRDFETMARYVRDHPDFLTRTFSPTSSGKTCEDARSDFYAYLKAKERLANPADKGKP